MPVPVAIFGYNRPAHIDRLLKSLSKCARLDEVEIVYFCDGQREKDEPKAIAKTRRVVRQWQKRLGGHVVEKPKNHGLARSILEGASALCADFGRVIVLEDDLVLNKGFLDFHLQALDHYADNEKVWQISGFSFRMEPPAVSSAYFLPIISTWGWSTWARAWKQFNPEAISPEGLEDDAVRRRFDLDDSYPYSQMLRDSLRGQNASWGIRWNWHVFQRQGLTLYPPHSLACNAGFDSSGAHCHTGETKTWQPTDKEVRDYKLPPISFPTPTADDAQREQLKKILVGMQQ